MPDDDDDDFWDDRDDYEPDPTDYLERQAEEERAEREVQVHGGERCNCPPGKPLPARRRLTESAAALAAGALEVLRRRTWSVRLGQFEVTLRRRPASPCGTCKGRGWWYTKGTVDPYPPPPGYDGATLCPCGSAVDELADSRREMRRWERKSRTEPLF